MHVCVCAVCLMHVCVCAVCLMHVCVCAVCLYMCLCMCMHVNTGQFGKRVQLEDSGVES